MKTKFIPHIVRMIQTQTKSQTETQSQTKIQTQSQTKIQTQSQTKMQTQTQLVPSFLKNFGFFYLSMFNVCFECSW